MKHWGPADWYVIASGAFVLVGIVWACFEWFGENFRLSDFRGPLIKHDERNKVPYRRR